MAAIACADSLAARSPCSHWRRGTPRAARGSSRSPSARWCRRSTSCVTTGTFIVGKVTDQHGAPVIGAEVSAQPERRCTGRRTFTDADGLYRIGPVTGQIELHASAYGHVDVRRTRRPPAGEDHGRGAPRGCRARRRRRRARRYARRRHGAPVGGAQLEVLIAGGDESRARRSPHGTARSRLDMLPRGRVRAPGHATPSIRRSSSTRWPRPRRPARPDCGCRSAARSRVRCSTARAARRSAGVMIAAHGPAARSPRPSTATAGAAGSSGRSRPGAGSSRSSSPASSRSPHGLDVLRGARAGRHHGARRPHRARARRADRRHGARRARPARGPRAVTVIVTPGGATAEGDADAQASSGSTTRRPARSRSSARARRATRRDAGHGARRRRDPRPGDRAALSRPGLAAAAAGASGRCR